MGFASDALVSRVHDPNQGSAVMCRCLLYHQASLQNVIHNNICSYTTELTFVYEWMITTLTFSRVIIFIYVLCMRVHNNWIDDVLSYLNLDCLEVTYMYRWYPAKRGPTRHAYARQIGPFWQDTLGMRGMFYILLWTGNLIQ